MKNEDYKKPTEEIIEFHKKLDKARSEYINLCESETDKIVDSLAEVIRNQRKIISQLKEMLTNEHGECEECITAKLDGFTICGDCSN